MNIYGDTLTGTTGKYGADISTQRMDELDIESIRHVLKIHGTNKNGTVIDIGCGVGMHGLRMAALGVRTLLIDWIPIEMTVMQAQGIGALLPISYLMIDARKLTKADFRNTEIIMAYSQRFIHYLRYREALGLLRIIRKKMPSGAKLFLSASGIDSELGYDYHGRDSAMKDRFSVLSGPMAEKHSIREPVCLYSESELITLCEKASFDRHKVFKSSFGNIKGVFTAA